ncbi:MlaD family protein [Empedobacter sedimenti]|uniref:MlaD family protein n=1 Tax=Empedobacter sedimenti TaxID=3042610 RepID=UPI0024A63AE9|nr:MlaD family protein [Empedobacter sedimenti]
MKLSKELKIGIITIITLIGFFMLFNFLKGQNIFSSGRLFTVKFENVNGLAPSKPVSINGLRVGQVKEIKIIDTAKPIYFEVVISVEKNIQFSKQTVAEIYEPGIMSGPEIRLLLDYGPDVAKDGDFLPGRIAGGMLDGFTKQLTPTQAKLDSVLLSFNQTLGSVNNVLDPSTQQDIKLMLRNLNHTIDSFDKTAQSLTATSNSANNLIKTNEKTLNTTLNNASATMASAKATVDKFGKTADKLNALELDQVIKNFENASKNLNTLLEDMNNGKGSLGKLAKDETLANELEATIKNMNELVSDLKKNPSRYVNISVFGKKQPVQP